MGGYFSTRWGSGYRRKPTVNEVPSFGVKDIDGLKESLAAHDDRLPNLEITGTVNNLSIQQQIELTISQRTFGREVYMLCPVCGERCKRVYLRWEQYQCRVCADLIYRSQLQKKNPHGGFTAGLPLDALDKMIKAYRRLEKATRKREIERANIAAAKAIAANRIRNR